MKGPIAHWKQAFKKHGAQCVYCPRERKVDFCGTLDNYLLSSVDHIIPITKGGGNHLDNIVPACLVCNFHKKEHVIAPEVFAQLTEQRADGHIYVKQRSMRHYLHLMRRIVEAEKKWKKREFEEFRDYVKVA